MLRDIRIVWYREFLNYIRDRARIISSLVMSLAMLFVFNYALGDFDTSMLGVEQIQYLLPGIIAITIFSTSLSNALSVVQDKSEGFMKEFLVSPASRASIAIGKILGGSTSAVIQAMIIIVVSPLFGMKYSIIMLIGLFIGMVAVSIAISSFGLFLATKIKSTMGFQMIIQMLMMPMMFLSGAFVPVSLLPTWLQFFVYINPVTYAVSAFRNITLNTGEIPVEILEEMGLIFKFGDFVVTPVISILLLFFFGIVFLLLAIRSFKKVSVTEKVKARGGRMMRDH